MFDAYKVAVRLTLFSNVGEELAKMSGLFTKVGKDVVTLQRQLSSLKKVAIVSGASAAGGFLGLDLIRKSLKPAEDYAHQLNIMNMAGMKQRDIALAVGAAWKTTSTILTSTATGNLQTFMDLRNIFGDVSNGKVANPRSAAIQDLPELVRIGAVLKSSSTGAVRDNADNLAFSIAKALDMRNAVSSPAVFNQQAEMMTKVITALQGRVTPEDYRMLFKYGRQSIPGLSNQFLYEELPTFMMEMKGKMGSGGQGGFGTSLAAFYRFFVQGTMTKGAMQGMQSIGLLPQNAGIRTTTVGTQLKFGQHIKGVEQAASDPFQWTQDVLLPAIRKKYGSTLNHAQLNLAIGEIMKGAPQLAIFAVEQYAWKAQNVYRDQKLIQEAQNSTSAYKMAISSDPQTAFAALNAQWQNFQTAFTMGIIPIVVPALISLTTHLNEFAQWARSNPNAARRIVEGFALLSATLTGFGVLVGVITVRAIFRASAALTLLNSTLARTATVAGVNSAGGAAGGIAKAAGTGVLASAGFIGAALGTLGFGAYKLYETDWKGVGQEAEALWKEGVARNNPTPPPINIQIDGRTIAQITGDYLNKQLNRQQYGTSNFSILQNPTPVGTSSPTT